MSERPILSIEIEHNTFLQYYYLKEELVTFCRTYGLSTKGGKQDITKRIDYFLQTGEELKSSTSKRKNNGIILSELTLNSVIEENFVCSEKHRTFFKSEIGASFSFNVPFQKYLKNSPGKQYSDAVNEWYKIQEDKKKNNGTSHIDSQFEYNTYIRDFFKENNDNSLKSAIQCWTYKKSLAGHNRYERQDLSALKSLQ